MSGLGQGASRREVRPVCGEEVTVPVRSCVKRADCALRRLHQGREEVRLRSKHNAAGAGKVQSTARGGGVGVWEARRTRCTFYGRVCQSVRRGRHILARTVHIRRVGGQVRRGEAIEGAAPLGRKRRRPSRAHSVPRGVHVRRARLPCLPRSRTTECEGGIYPSERTPGTSGRRLRAERGIVRLAPEGRVSSVNVRGTAC